MHGAVAESAAALPGACAKCFRLPFIPFSNTEPGASQTSSSADLSLDHWHSLHDVERCLPAETVTVLHSTSVSSSDIRSDRGLLCLNRRRPY